MPSYYPVFLDLKGRKCVIIGGGQVAERKVPPLLECDAKVAFVSPQITPSIQRWVDEGKVSWERRDYAEGDLKGAFLAIAATDEPQINRAIAREAAEKNILLNVVDVTPLCTFIAPATVKRGDVVVAISTGGASPALARKLRETLENSDLLDYADLAEILSRARREVKERKIQVHPDRWQEYINGELMAMVKEGREQEALDYLLKGLSKNSLQKEARE